MRILVTVLLGLGITLTAQAQTLTAALPDAPTARPEPAPAPSPVVKLDRCAGFGCPVTRYSKRLFWTEAGAYTAINALDGYTTVRMIRMGTVEAQFPKGSAFILGRHPGAGRYVAVMGGIEVASILLSHKLEHSNNKFLRTVGHGLMGVGIAAHADGAISNLRFIASPPWLNH